MKHLFFLAATIAVLSSCSNKEDDTDPVIQYVRINGTEAPEHDLEAGQTVAVSVSLTDNEELNQVKLEIHAADDGHTHEGGGSSEPSGPNTGVWVDSRIINLDGTSAERSVNFTVPLDVAGYWHLEVLLIDREGNEAEEYVTTLHVENPDLPVVTITTNPAAVGEYVEITPGSEVGISVTASDEEGLGIIHIEVESEGGTVLFEQEYDAAGAATFTADGIAVAFPLAGHYHIHVEATDSGGLTRMAEQEVHVE